MKLDLSRQDVRRSDGALTVRSVPARRGRGAAASGVVRFALAREAEADTGRTDTSADEEPGEMLSEEELDILTVGFMTIRDQEPLDDVANWANAVLALLADERA